LNEADVDEDEDADADEDEDEDADADEDVDEDADADEEVLLDEDVAITNIFCSSFQIKTSSSTWWMTEEWARPVADSAEG
jgi:hypothetical protein